MGDGSVTPPSEAATGNGGAEITLPGELESVPQARRFVREALDGDPVTDDAQLVTAELVTNAVLHGAPPIVLRVRRLDGRVRIEVQDTGAALPVRARSSAEAMTGRGLGLVDALSTEWRVDKVSGGGKVVWAELGGETESIAGSDVPEDLDALLAAWADDDFDDVGERVFVVELGDVPTDLLLDAKAHIDNLVREFILEAAAASETQPLAPQLAHLVETVVHGFAEARTQVKRQALAAAGRGEVDTHLALTLPASAADAGVEYLAALDEADRYARAARLLSLETPPVHRVFRRWYVEGLITKLRAQAAGDPVPPVPTFPQQLAAEVTALAPLRETATRLALLQRVTAELTAASDAAQIAECVVTNAVSAFGAHAARVYALNGDLLRMMATAGGGDSDLASQYADVPVSTDLPGGVALRTGQPVVVRNLADLAEQFPALAGSYPDERSLLVAPLIAGDHQLGVLALTFRGESRVDEETQRAFLTTLADVTAQALERAAAVSVAVAAVDRLRFLSDASVVLATGVDDDEVLDALAALVVPRLADWCLIELLEDGQLVTVSVAHGDPSVAEEGRAMAARFPVDMSAGVASPHVVRTGQSQVFPQVTEELLAAVAVDDEHLAVLRGAGLTSALVVPLKGRTGMIGAITMIHADSGRTYTDDDQILAEDLAHRAALAVETARALRGRS